MSSVLNDFVLPRGSEATEPPEARGIRRDGVRMMVSRRRTGEITHHAFTGLPGLLLPGDLMVVNTSGTLPAAVPVSARGSTALPGTVFPGDTPDPDGPIPPGAPPASPFPLHLPGRQAARPHRAGGSGLRVHFSTPLPDGGWLAELRAVTGHATQPHPGGEPGQRLTLPGGAVLTLAERVTGRLWRVRLSTAVVPYLLRHGSYIHYSYVERDWPASAYQTAFAATPGSAEMPSASRPFTPEMVTKLVVRGITIAPLTLHTGVSSLEGDEQPYPEPFDVPPATARLVNATRQAGGRVIAIGTTVVRALESAALAGGDGQVAAASGWTHHVVTPQTGVRVVDALFTGLHEPRSSHLRMLSAFAGEPLLRRCYAAAIEHSYLWHEFGDVHLLMP
jgi:S-adenosylmethionine:tRNA ribosyltransferase-isomerase